MEDQPKHIIDDESTVASDSSPCVNDLIIEEVPDLEDNIVHDQLPSVEEYKTNNDVKSQATNFTKTKRLALSVASVIVLVITIIAVASKHHHHNKRSHALSKVGRTEQVEDYLYVHNISTLPTLRQAGSAQHRATAFIADGDALQLDMNDSLVAKRFEERYVLALLYYAFHGAQWTYNLQFLSGRDHCEWNKDIATTSGKTIRQGVVCNADGYVVELNLGK